METDLSQFLVTPEKGNTRQELKVPSFIQNDCNLNISKEEDDIRLQEIDREIDNLEKSMSKISNYQLKTREDPDGDESPYNSKVEPVRFPSPPNKNFLHDSKESHKEKDKRYDNRPINQQNFHQSRSVDNLRDYSSINFIGSNQRDLTVLNYNIQNANGDGKNKNSFQDDNLLTNYEKFKQGLNSNSSKKNRHPFEIIHPINLNTNSSSNNYQGSSNKDFISKESNFQANSNDREFSEYEEKLKIGQYASKRSLLKLTINDIVLSLTIDDTPESMARRYFERIEVIPMAKDLTKLSEIIGEKVNKKIEYLEKFFKRSLAKKDLDDKRSSRSKPKTISIDLSVSNKENTNMNNFQRLNTSTTTVATKTRENIDNSKRKILKDASVNDNSSLKEQIIHKLSGKKESTGKSYVSSYADKVKDKYKGIGFTPKLKKNELT